MSAPTSIERLFASTYAPQVQSLAADLMYRQVEPEGMDVAGFWVQAAANRHPGKALSYRIRYGPDVVVYSTDHEAGDQAVDAKLVELAQGAPFWILDAMYTPEQRQHREGRRPDAAFGSGHGLGHLGYNGRFATDNPPNR